MHPELGTIRLRFHEPIIAEPIRPDKITSPARDIDQNLAVHGRTQREMPVRISKYVPRSTLINRDRRHAIDVSGFTPP
jgi:hypothetical protein